MPTLFISYKRGTAATAPLMERLRAEHYRLWFDRDEINLGDPDWQASINRGLEHCDAVILCITPAAVQSEAVRYELRKATELGKPIFPIVLERVNDYSTALRELGLSERTHLEDFTDITLWNAQIDRLLRDFEAQGLRVTQHKLRGERETAESKRLHIAYLTKLIERIDTLNFAQIVPASSENILLEDGFVIPNVNLSLSIELNNSKITDWWLSSENERLRSDSEIIEKRTRPQEIGFEESPLEFLIGELQEQINSEILSNAQGEQVRKQGKGEEESIVFDETESELESVLHTNEPLISWADGVKYDVVQLGLDDSAASCSRLVILGQAGAGKSTFLKYLALCLAGTQIETWNRKANLEALKTWTHGSLTPVYIEMRRFVASRHFPETEVATIDHVWNYIVDELVEADLEAYASDLRIDIENGEVILLFDGLDEVPYHEGQLHQRQNQLQKLFASISTIWGRCRFLVTTRPYAYAGWALPGFQEVNISPLSAQQRGLLVFHLYRSAGLSIEDAQEQALQLNDQLRSIDPELSRSPLFLSILATVYLRNNFAGLPTRRSAFYYSSIQLLLDRWTQSKPGTPSLMEILGDRTQNDLYTRLASLAYDVQEMFGDQPSSPEITEALLYKHLKPLGRSTAAELIPYLSENAGILISPGQDNQRDVFHFAHRTFQEYLAAVHLVKLCADQDSFELVRTHIINKPQIWRTSCILVADVLADTDRRSDLWDMIDDLLDDDVPETGLDASDPRAWAVWLASTVVREHKLYEGQLRRSEQAIINQLITWMRIVGLGQDLLPETDVQKIRETLALFGQQAPPNTPDTSSKQASISPNSAIVRILAKDNNKTIGVGFLATKRHILTPAHVVTMALGLPHKQESMPSENVQIDFPLTNSRDSTFRASPIIWLPANDTNVEDICVLELLDEPPAESSPLKLEVRGDYTGLNFSVFGFPAGYTDGVFASGVVAGVVGHGRIQLNVNLSGYSIGPGFSGGCVVDQETKRVIGMVIAVDASRDVRAAFMIPARGLSEIIDQLPRSGMSADKSKHIRIFLASPGDLANDRAIASDIIDKLPFDPFLRDKVTIQLVAWDRTSTLTAMPANMTPQEAINRGLPKPSECDIVVVLLWSRMGTPLDPEMHGRKPDGEAYLSGTEWEYWDAYNAAQKTGTPPHILIYRRTEEPQINPGDQWQEKIEQYERVKAFFETFKNPDGSIKAGYNTYETSDDFRQQFEAHIKSILQQILNVEGFNERVSPSPSATWQGSPYPGLRAFTEADAPVFFGRGRETDQLMQLIANQRFVVVVGASGSGKSSLVSAGLFPRLRANGIERSKDWHLIRFTPENQPFESLARAILESTIAPNTKPTEFTDTLRNLVSTLQSSPGALHVVATQILQDEPELGELLVFIDQFEEVFTLNDSQVRSSFIDLVTYSSNKIRFVITLRADFYGDAVSSPALANILRTGSFPVSAPSHTALYDIITRPAQMVGLQFEDGLVERILDDTGSEPGSLPILAYLLDELYALTSASASKLISWTNYNSLGAVQGVIAVRAERLFATLQPEVQETLQRVMGELVQVDESGLVTLRRSSLTQVARNNEAVQFIEAMTNARLFVVSSEGNTTFVEIAHEAILHSWERLKAWLDSASDDLRLLRQIRQSAHEWDQSGRNDDYKWVGSRRDLAIQAVLRLKPALSEQEMNFLDIESLEDTIIDESLESMESVENPSRQSTRSIYMGLQTQSTLWNLNEVQLLHFVLREEAFPGSHTIFIPYDSHEITVTLKGQKINVVGEARYTTPVDISLTRSISAYGTWIGQASLSVDIFNEGKLIDTIEILKISIIPDVVSRTEQLLLPPPSESTEPNGSQPDLTIRVYAMPLDEQGSILRFLCVAYSQYSYLKLEGRPVSFGKLSAYRDVSASLIDDLLIRFAYTAANGNSGSQMASELLEIGGLIWHEILPSGMREIYKLISARDQQGRSRSAVRSILFITDEFPWLPYELAVPRDKALCDEFEVSRWIEGLGQRRHTSFPLSSTYSSQDADLSEVLPNYTQITWGSDFTTSAFAANWRQGLQPDSPIHSFQNFMAGGFLKGKATNVILGNETFDWPVYLHQQKELMQAKNPIVINLSIADSRGKDAYNQELIKQAIQSGAAALIGNWWSVSPMEARVFSQVFYQKLDEMVSLGEAVFHARQAVKLVSADSTTALSFFVIGDPSASGYPLIEAEGYLSISYRGKEDVSQIVFSDGDTLEFDVLLRQQPPAQYNGKRYLLKPWRELNLSLSANAVGCDLEFDPKPIEQNNRYIRWVLKLSPREMGKTILSLKCKNGDSLFANLDDIILDIQHLPNDIIEPIFTPPSRYSVQIDLLDALVYRINTENHPYGKNAPPRHELQYLRAKAMHLLSSARDISELGELTSGITESISRLLNEPWWENLEHSTHLSLIDKELRLLWEIAINSNKQFWGTQFALGHMPNRNQAAEKRIRIGTIGSYVHQMYKDHGFEQIYEIISRPYIDAAQSNLGFLQVNDNSWTNICDLHARERSKLLVFTVAGNVGGSFEQQTLDLELDDHLIRLPREIKTARKLGKKPIIVLNVITPSLTSDPVDVLPFIYNLLRLDALAVVAPICALPSEFSQQFSHHFLEELYLSNAHSTIGIVLMKTRDYFVKKYDNPLALTYVLFGDPEIEVEFC